MIPRAAKRDSIVNTGSSASFGAPASPKTENGPSFGPLFLVGMGPSGSGILISSLFRGLGPLFGVKKMSQCEYSKNLRSHPVDRPEMHVVCDIMFYECASYLRKSAHRKNAYVFKMLGPLIFALFFSTICGTVVEKMMGLVFWDPLAHFAVQEARNFGAA